MLWRPGSAWSMQGVRQSAARFPSITAFAPGGLLVTQTSCSAARGGSDARNGDGFSTGAGSPLAGGASSVDSCFSGSDGKGEGFAVSSGAGTGCGGGAAG